MIQTVAVVHVKQTITYLKQLVIVVVLLVEVVVVVVVVVPIAVEVVWTIQAALNVIMDYPVLLDQLMFLSAKKNLVSLAVVTVNVHLDHVSQYLVIRRSTVARVIALSVIPVEIAICVPQIITKKTINALHVLLV